MGIAKFEIRRKCMVCGEPFMAKTVESWYCSPRCSKIAYKRRRDEEIRHSCFRHALPKLLLTQSSTSRYSSACSSSIPSITLVGCV